MLWSLYMREPGTLATVVLVATAVLGLELLYFEREWLEREVEEVERALPG